MAAGIVRHAKTIHTMPNKVDKCMFKRHMKTIIVSILFVLLYYITSIEAKTFKVASYNLENLFDLATDGTEYPEYIPNTGYGWTIV